MSGIDPVNTPVRHDDAIANLLIAFVALALAAVLVAAVPPSTAIVGPMWILLGMSIVALLAVALWRRDRHLIRFVFLAAGGMAAVAVGVGYPLFMATQSPQWLLGAGALICYLYAAVGLMALWATRRPKAK